MMQTFRLDPQFDPHNYSAYLGELPAGRLIKCEPFVEDGKMFWLIEVDVGPLNTREAGRSG